MKKVLLLLVVIVMVLSLSINAGADAPEDHWDFEPEIKYYDEDDKSHPEIDGDGYYIDDGYDLVYNLFGRFDYHDMRYWRTNSKKTDETIQLYFHDVSSTPAYAMYGCKSCAKLTVRIPDTVNGIPVSELYRSSDFKAFDVNPQNIYLKSDSQAVFSKDGKKLMSYACYNESTEYFVPRGTEIICYASFCDCDNIKTVYIPNSVEYIARVSFQNMDSLESVSFESFVIEIEFNAFDVIDTLKPNVNLICTEKSDVVSDKDRLSWEKINGATYYEIYQKLSNGEYKLLTTRKGTSCKFTTLKPGKKYTFAVKPVAVIPAASYDKEKHEGKFPETFTIEGTMSEDIVIVG
ncbi:MAG: leucine-rich repeat protein [Ruminococcus sp.]|nr:leucine-rich repeat protein [Ruminococcus sp.]